MKKTFTKLLMLLGLFAFLGAGNASAWTVYFNNYGLKWTGVNIWAYNSASNLTGNNWPGSSMNRMYDNMYSYEGTGNPTDIIFSQNGNNQVDFKGQFKDGAVYTKRDDVVYYTYPTDWYFNVNGGFNEWGNPATGKTNGTQLSAGSSTITWTNVEIGNTEFKIQIWDGKNDCYYSTGGQVTADGKEIQLAASPSNNMTVKDATSTSKYNITYNWETNKMTIKPANGHTVKMSDWYLRGNMFSPSNNQNEKTWESKAMIDNGDGTFSLTWDVKFTDGEFFIHKGDDYNNGEVYKTWTDDDRGKLWVGHDVHEMYKEQGNDINCRYGLAAGKYTFNWFPNEDGKEFNNRMNVVAYEDQPSEIKTVYIYGHIKDQYWKKEFREKMTEDKNEPGVFWAHKLLVRGRWSDRDHAIEPARTVGESTNGENYVGFFVTERDNYNSPLMKFGSCKFHNQDVWQVAEGNGNSETLEDKTLNVENEYQENPMKWVRQGDTNNFRVYDGVYDVKFNLNDMTVRFYKIKEESKIPTEYIWFQDKDVIEVLKDDNGDFYENIKAPAKEIDQNYHILYDTETYLQIGANETDDEETSADTMHPLAQQVIYTVWYKEYTGSSKVKRQAGSTGYTSDKEVTDDNYRPIGENEGYYTLEGSSKIGSNHLITLRQVGEYVIKASLSNSATGVSEYEKPIDNYLAVTIARDFATGVEGIEAAEDGEAVYYNLQGVKVQNPENGIFIKVQNGKSEKVVK